MIYLFHIILFLVPRIDDQIFTLENVVDNVSFTH